jgi:hypothetical protein
MNKRGTHLLFSSSQELLAVLLLLLLGSASEEFVVDLGNINTRDVDFGAGRDDVGLVDAAQRNAVDLVRA